MRLDEAAVEAGEDAAGDVEAAWLAVKRTDACLAGTLFVTAVERDRGRWLTFDEGGDGRCGGMVDEGDRLECLMRDGQVSGSAEAVEGDGRRLLVRGGTVRDSTR